MNSSTPHSRVHALRQARVIGLGVGVLASCLLSVPATSQQAPGAVPGGASPAGAPAPKATKPAAAPKAPKADVQGGTGGGDAGLRQRIEGLEEQLVDLQVVIGTLESLAKSSGAASASATYRAGSAGEAGSTGADSARIAGLEAQIRNLTSQVQQLSEQVRAMGGQPTTTPAQPRREGALNPNGSPSGTVAPPSPPGWAASPVAPARAEGNGFGASAGPGDVASGNLPPVAVAAPAGDPASAKQAYETAYQYLLQQDYGAAETAFDDFLKRYPNDSLAGNAQFWLGESYFVRGQFKAAASAFLKGYQSYGRSSKAPDSLLKLAMSLGRLGQKDAACSSLAELNTRFPTATADVKSRAVAEKQRTGCP